MKKSPILVVVLIFSGLAACQNENPNREIIKPSGDPALVSVTIKGGSGNMISRANGTPIPGTPQEDNFTKIEFFVYEEDGSPDTSYPYFSPTATTGTYTFLVTAGENKKFIVAINQELGAAAAGTTYSEMKQTLAKKMLFTASQNDSQTAIDDGIGYAMAGEGTQTVTQGNPNRLDITVSRLLSRVRTPKVKGADGNFA